MDFKFISWWFELPIKKITLSKSNFSKADKSSRLFKFISLFFNSIGGFVLPTEIILSSFLSMTGPKKPLPPNNNVLDKNYFFLFF